jgi:hypothetical protein
MKPHKHAELIKAWADGAEIQMLAFNDWIDIDQDFIWRKDVEYRIKPEPKPDDPWLYFATNRNVVMVNYENPKPNLKLTFDGETGELKSAEVLK